MCCKPRGESPGLDLTGLRIEARVQDAGVGSTRAVGKLALGLQQHRRDAAARECVRHRGADHAAADDRYRGVGHER